jgi:hypothetical protein
MVPVGALEALPKGGVLYEEHIRRRTTYDRSKL